MPIQTHTLQRGGAGGTADDSNSWIAHQMFFPPKLLHLFEGRIADGHVNPFPPNFVPCKVVDRTLPGEGFFYIKWFDFPPKSRLRILSHIKKTRPPQKKKPGREKIQGKRDTFRIFSAVVGFFSLFCPESYHLCFTAFQLSNRGLYLFSRSRYLDTR